MEKLSKPPLVVATLRVTFPHNLRISELRSAYYEDIKESFPQIQFPEIKQIVYDFSDCHFQNPEGKTQVNLATNYFSLGTIQYKNVNEFWSTFHSVFDKFVKRVNVSEITGMTVEFLNQVSIDAEKVGTDFNDYFTLALTAKGGWGESFLTFDGAIIFRVGQGLLQVNVRPLQNVETRLFDKFEFKITFLSNNKCSVDIELKEVKNIFLEGHHHIEDLFRTSLTEKYWETIK